MASAPTGLRSRHGSRGRETLDDLIKAANDVGTVAVLGIATQPQGLETGSSCAVEIFGAAISHVENFTGRHREPSTCLGKDATIWFRDPGLG